MRKNLFKKSLVINKYQDLINQINLLEDKFKTLSDSDLRAKSFKLKKQYKQNQDLNSLIV